MSDSPKLPKAVTVAGKQYAIVGESKGDLGAECVGHASHKHLVITYDDGWADQQIKDTIWHECLHCAEEAAGLSLKEREVQALATLTLGILWDNPELTKWLIRK